MQVQLSKVGLEVDGPIWTTMIFSVDLRY